MRICDKFCASGEATILKFRFADKTEKMDACTRLHGPLD